MNTLLRRAALDENISKHTLRVFDVLLQAFEEESRHPSITISEVARRLRLPERTVCRAFNALKNGGYITREHYRDAAGRNCSVTHILATA